MKCYHPVLTIAVVLLLGTVAMSDPPTEADNGTAPTSGLGIRQQHVQRLMLQLDSKFVLLAQTLAKSEPERAARLQKALEASKQLSLERRMAAITELLDASHLDKATEEQKKVIKDLDHLAEILLGEDGRNEKAAEIQRLEDWQRKLQGILGQQHNHQLEDSKLADKDKTIADLQRQIAAVEKLIERQQKLIADTQQTRQHGLDGLHDVAGRQHDLRNDTEQLARQVDGNAGPVKPGADNQDQHSSPPSDTHGGKQSDPHGSPQDGHQNGQPGDQQNGKPGDQQHTGKPPGQQGDQPPAASNHAEQPGAKPLSEAASHQHDAETKLDSGRGKEGQQEQEVALSKLRKALEDLKKEKDRFASLLPEELNRKAGENQAQTADKTGQIGDDIAAAGQQGGPQPAQQAVKDAHAKMQQAGKELGQNNPGSAVPPAAGAEEDIKKALKEIEDKLAQLREEERIEKLAKLEARFREMLVRQQAATTATTDIQKNRPAAGSLRRSDIILLAKQADEERALADMAEQALEIIRDDGTSVVFPRIVDRMLGDLKRVAGWLDQKDTGARTHVAQVEIEGTLEELIAALKEAQKKSKPGQAGDPSDASSQPSEQDEPLMPDSAELKLLQAAQLRVNRMTKEFAGRQANQPLDNAGREEVHQISRRQEDISIMTREMIERK